MKAGSIYLDKCIQLESLRHQFKTLSLQKDIERTKKLKSKINALESEIKRIDKIIGITTIPHGNYKRALDER